jgi:hypothetical protein
MKLHLTSWICASDCPPVVYGWIDRWRGRACPLEILRKTRGEHSVIFFSIE